MANIEGGVTIINTITQANNQDFPVAMAQDIGMEDGSNVEDRLSGLKNYVHPTTPGYRHIPSGGSEGQILKYKEDGEAEWADELDTSYEEATPEKAGLMSAADKTKLNTIAEGANKYVHPTHTEHESGFYKVTVDNLGHVTAVSSVTKEDISDIGISPGDLNIGNATSDSAGLMSAEDKEKLDGIATGANNYTHPAYTQRASGLYKITVDNTGHVSSVAAVTKGDITNLGIPAQDTNTIYEVATTSVSGLMSSADKTKLNGIAENANNYVHPTSSGNKHIPSGGTTGQVLQYASDGTAKWATLVETTYDEATTDKAGLMSASDKAKLNGIASNANNYTHPTYTQRTSGLYKITVDGTGHVNNAVAVSKTDITDLGIPAQDTTYSVANSSTNGLMSSTDKKKLDGIAEGATKYTHPSYTQRASGFYKITVDNTGHVSNVTAVSKTDITELGIPSQDTTYSVATTSANGLMSSTDKSKLDGIASNANNYTHPTYSAKSSGLYKITVDGTGHVSATEAVTKEDLVTINPGLQIGFASEAPSSGLNVNDLWIQLEGEA